MTGELHPGGVNPRGRGDRATTQLAYVRELNDTLRQMQDSGERPGSMRDAFMQTGARLLGPTYDAALERILAVKRSRGWPPPGSSTEIRLRRDLADEAKCIDLVERLGPRVWSDLGLAPPQPPSTRDPQADDGITTRDQREELWWSLYTRLFNKMEQVEKAWSTFRKKGVAAPHQDHVGVEPDVPDESLCWEGEHYAETPHWHCSICGKPGARPVHDGPPVPVGPDGLPAIDYATYAAEMKYVGAACQHHRQLVTQSARKELAVCVEVPPEGKS